MRTHTKAGLIFSAILISCACINGADTIELPFDYFYGRWTTGHFLDGGVYYQEDHVKRGLDYSYTSEKERVCLDYIPRYLVISNQNDKRLYTPSMSYYRRPVPSWQIGIDSLMYREWYYNLDGYENPWDIDRQSGIVARSNWMNSPAFDITEQEAPFVYRFQPILTPGQIRLENRLSLSYRGLKRSVENIFFPTDHAAYYANLSREYKRYEWCSENSIRWGIRSDLNMILDLGLVYATEKYSGIDYVDNQLDGRETFIRNDQTFRRRYQPNYGIGAFYGGLNPVFLTGVFRQEYSQVSERGYDDRTPLFSPLPDTVCVTSGDLQESQTSFSLTTYYVSQGEFESAVVLDDYNGFYHNMLFHNQFAGYLEVLTETEGRAMYADQNLARIDLSASYGLWNHLELAASAAYEWLERSDSGWVRWPREESRSMDFTLKYRSYAYRPGEGPGWSRDDRYDILFGVVPQFGQVYIEAKYTPPVYTGYYRDEVGFLAFKNLEKGEQSQLDLETSFGLGQEFVLTSSHVVKYLHGSLSKHEYAFNLCRRVRNIELSLQYEEIYVNSEFDDTTIIGRLRLLL